MHAFLEDTSNALPDRAICGHLLHMLYCRARWSDLVSVQELYIDPDMRYLELVTTSHKGARHADTKARLLPLVSPCQGITSSNWVDAYMAVRESCGLADPDEIPVAMLRAPLDASGLNWGSRYVTSSEGSAFLRVLLELPADGSRRLSSHSMKSTAISWCSKFGLDEQTKALLARRTSAVKQPQALYSRDLLSPVLRSFDQVLAAIRDGNFEPDRTRSGMIKMDPGMQWTYGFQQTTVGVPATPVMRGDVESVPATPAPQTGQVRCQVQEVDGEAAIVDGGFQLVEPQCEVKGEQLRPLHAGPNDGTGHQPVAVSDDEAEGVWSESTESSCEESSDPSDDDVEIEHHFDEEADRLLLAVGQSSNWLINVKSLVLHCKRNDKILMCGRRLGPNYVPVRELRGFRCSRCFNV